MHSMQPHTLLRICRGLFEALRPMLHHLFAHFLLGYQGDHVDGIPAPADCTGLRLRHHEFGENRADERHRVGER
ncbi:hypothetical protein DIZ27_23290 [Streptomyces sp. NWU339]|nr:hypothetical protein DIZ27_23290 [Streptomyces sp. NWU339]